MKHRLKPVECTNFEEVASLIPNPIERCLGYFWASNVPRAKLIHIPFENIFATPKWQMQLPCVSNVTINSPSINFKSFVSAATYLCRVECCKTDQLDRVTMLRHNHFYLVMLSYN